MLDLGFGFLLKNYVSSRLETSGNSQCDQNTIKFSFEYIIFYLISGLVRVNKIYMVFTDLLL